MTLAHSPAAHTHREAEPGVVGWKPIETAPDGKVLVVEYGGDISVAERFPDGWTAVAAGLYVEATAPNTGHKWEMVYPTHWMPLPALPEPATAPEAGAVGTTEGREPK